MQALKLDIEVDNDQIVSRMELEQTDVCDTTGDVVDNACKEAGDDLDAGDDMSQLESEIRHIRRQKFTLDEKVRDQVSRRSLFYIFSCDLTLYFRRMMLMIW